MRKIFYDDMILEQYEQTEQWDKCVSYLYKLAMDDLDNRNLWLRLAAQSWYTLTFWDCYMKKDNLDRNIFETYLEKAYYKVFQDWWDDADCLWLFGYFMCINPLDFSFLDKDMNDIELMGNDLISKAYSIDSTNPLAEVLFLADNGKKKHYIATKKKLKNRIGDFFSDKSLVEQYFLEIFTEN